MFERFNDGALRVVVLAQEESRLLNHNYIGTEHILLGLIHQGEGIAAQVLKSLGVELDQVRLEIEEIIGVGGSAPSGHIPFTPRGRKVLELALREALQLGHNYIDTEHILLGLVREGEGVGAQVLTKLGVELSRVRQVVVQLLQTASNSADRPLPREVPAPVQRYHRLDPSLVITIELPWHDRQATYARYNLLRSALGPVDPIDGLINEIHQIPEDESSFMTTVGMARRAHTWIEALYGIHRVKVGHPFTQLLLALNESLTSAIAR